MAKKKFNFEDNVPIMNHDVWIKYFNSIKNKDKFNEMLCLFGVTAHELKTLYGKQSTTAVFSHRHWIWEKEVDGYIFYIMHSVRGTTHEVIYPDGHDPFRNDKKVGKAIKKYMRIIINDVKSIRVIGPHGFLKEKRRR
jgi:hypothetical protein